MKKHLPPVSFRATPDERKRIKMDARLAGMSMGSYIRSRLLEQPQTAAVFRRTETKRLITKLIGQIGKVGNNMNQIAWKQNSDQALTRLDMKLHEEGVRSLDDMRHVLINHMLQNGPC